MDWYRSGNSIGIKPDLLGFGKGNGPRIVFKSGSTASMEDGKNLFYFVKSGKKNDEDEGMTFGYSNCTEISTNLVESEVVSDERKKNWSPGDDGIDMSIEGICANPLKMVRSPAKRLPVFEEILARERT